MANERPGQTVVDYVVIVLSPVLIMGLVGSLVFFLIEVFYKSDGQWKERLQWILFFFVFGSVLTARISMMGDIAHRAKMYGGILAAATYLGIAGYVEMPEAIRPISFLINLFLILLVWWCVHRLVWDCTHVDEQTDMNAAGLLQITGLTKPSDPPEEEIIEEVEVERAGKVKLTGFDLWWQRFQRYREQQGKKRSLGAWVVYFSLAALPIFGLGQAFIPLTAPHRRVFAFWLLIVYVGCGLGLLLTTCFLGLRCYLRQKMLRMPGSMTRTWLLFGGGLILALLLVGGIIPRPHAEYSVRDLVDPAGSAQRRANQRSAKSDSPGEGEGKTKTGSPKGKEDSDRKGEKGKEAGKEGQSGKGDKGDKGEQGEKKNEESSRSEKDSSREQQNRLAEVLQKVAPWLKWIVFGILGVFVVVAVLRGGLGWLANFTDWARRLLDAWNHFWESLFGPKQEDHGGKAAENEVVEPASVVPFHSFANPFDSGKADRMNPHDLVRYSFQALEAWAAERDCGRRQDETAQEFIRRLGDEVPTVEQDATRLGELHARVEYSRGSLPGGAVETVRRFWERLERVSEAPLSA